MSQGECGRMPRSCASYLAKETLLLKVLELRDHLLEVVLHIVGHGDGLDTIERREGGTSQILSQVGKREK